MAGRWGPLQVRASGLLGLLQLKDRGQNPNELVGDVVPTVDMVPWWLRGEREYLPQQSGVIAGADGNWQIFSMPEWRSPQNEWWHVEYITIEMTEDIEANYGFGYVRIVENYNSTDARVWWSSPHLTSNNSGTDVATVIRQFMTMGPIWVPPASEIELVHCFRATNLVSMSMAITRAKV